MSNKIWKLFNKISIKKNRFLKKGIKQEIKENINPTSFIIENCFQV